MFREDLYYRLNVINITIPPLRDRKEDIEYLAGYFLKKYSLKLSREISGFGPGVREMLNSYPWPGNARELENVMERAVIICDSEKIRIEDLSIQAAHTAVETSSVPSLEDMERDYVLRVLKDVNWNQSRASHVLGIDRKTLYLKLKKYGIS